MFFFPLLLSLIQHQLFITLKTKLGESVLVCNWHVRQHPIVLAVTTKMLTRGTKAHGEHHQAHHMSMWIPVLCSTILLQSSVSNFFALVLCEGFSHVNALKLWHCINLKASLLKIYRVICDGNDFSMGNGGRKWVPNFSGDMCNEAYVSLPSRKKIHPYD